MHNNTQTSTIFPPRLLKTCYRPLMATGFYVCQLPTNSSLIRLILINLWSIYLCYIQTILLYLSKCLPSWYSRNDLSVIFWGGKALLPNGMDSWVPIDACSDLLGVSLWHLPCQTFGDVSSSRGQDSRGESMLKGRFDSQIWRCTK